MTVGLVGSHRTGKTTLAKLFAERQETEFVQTSVSELFKQLGFDPKADYDFATRLFIQRKILETVDAQYCKASGVFITDRTPLDMLSYTLADVTRQNMTPEFTKEVMQYSRDCFEVTNRHFGLLMLVSPGIKIEEAEGKAPANEAYMDHIHYIALGLLVSQEVKSEHYYIPRHMTDLEDRYEALVRAVDKVQTSHQENILAGNIVFH